jgi:lipoprotein-releasing system ATP-binding protein
VSKDYAGPSGPVRVLSGVSFSLEPGGTLSIMGPSGSGKSTLLSILGTLEAPSAGRVLFDGGDPFALRPREAAAFRNERVGFVFQDHCLLPQCTVLENVLTPTLVARRREDYATRARVLLEAVGLGGRLDHRPGQLSGGEKQRTALARALVMRPGLLLCDEPTGNLDRRSADAVASLLAELHREHGTILVMATHSAELAARLSAPGARRQLVDGRLEPLS